MTNRIIKKSHFAKSKILLIILCILGLVFSYSCNCRNNSTAPGGGETETNDIKGTFKASINMDTLSDTLIVNSKSEVHNNSKLAISFTGKDGTDAVGFEVRITDMLDESADTPLDFSDDKANGYSKYISYNSDSGALTLTKDGLAKIGALVSDTSPVDRIVKITFDIVADSKLNLKNSTNTLTNEFYFVKAQKIDNNNIQSILNKMDSTAKLDFTNGLTLKDARTSHFEFSKGEYKTGVYTINDTADSNPMPSFLENNISEIDKYLGFYLVDLNEIDKATKSTTVPSEGGTGKQSYTVSFDIVYGNNFESTLTPLKFEFNLKK